MSYYLTEKAQRLLNELSGTEGEGVFGEGPPTATPSRPSLMPNNLRCPGCGAEGFVPDFDRDGYGWFWSFHCTDTCDRWFYVREAVKP